MIVKMCCDDITVLIICRMLHRSKFFDFLTNRKNNDTSRMLTGCTAYTGTSLYNTVNFAVTFVLTTLLIIVFYITKRGFLCQCTDRACFECLTFTKNNFCITMCICLIFTRKVKVDIRFFITLESKEGLKRNIKSFFIHFCSALRAYTVRHITTCHTTKLFDFR